MKRQNHVENHLFDLKLLACIWDLGTATGLGRLVDLLYHSKVVSSEFKNEFRALWTLALQHLRSESSLDR